LGSMKDIKLDRKKIELTDGKITLRPYHPRDIEATYEAIRESLAELAPWLPFAHSDYSRRESRDWIKQRPKDWEKGVAYEFAIFDAGDGAMLGGCGLNGVDKINYRANLGYWVRTGRTGQGIATAATQMLAKWGFEKLKLKRIEILVAVSNRRSLRVAEKAGAKFEGVLRNRINLNGKNEDAAMYSLIPGEI
jgi:ribosomal-protein-serine acetyltransferase